jgi:hypothetical protein
MATLVGSCGVPGTRRAGRLATLRGAPVRGWRWRWCWPAALLGGTPKPGWPNRPTRCHPIRTIPTCARLSEPTRPGRACASPSMRSTLPGQGGLRPMVLPADFPSLTVPEQLFVAVDRERVDRGLAPFTGLTTALDADALQGADAARLPGSTRPGLRLGGDRVDRGRRQRARCRLRVAVQRRPRQRRARVLGFHDVGLLG